MLAIVAVPPRSVTRTSADRASRRVAGKLDGRFEGTEGRDFGIAKASDNTEETSTGTVKGKIGYLSPEQCRGQKVDGRSDLFALGIVMWELLTTRRLFRRDGDFESMAAIATEAVSPPSQLRRDIPPELDALVGKLLEKLPADRYQSTDALIEDLEALSARTGAVLSRSGLSRLVRELFGTRQEPWIALEQEQEVITVAVEQLEPSAVEHEVEQSVDDPSLMALEAKLSSAAYTLPVPLPELEDSYTTGQAHEQIPHPDDVGAMTLIEPVRVEFTAPVPVRPAPAPPPALLPMPPTPIPAPSPPPARWQPIERGFLLVGAALVLLAFLIGVIVGE